MADILDFDKVSSLSGIDTVLALTTSGQLVRLDRTLLGSSEVSEEMLQKFINAFLEQSRNIKTIPVVESVNTGTSLPVLQDDELVRVALDGIGNGSQVLTEAEFLALSTKRLITYYIVDETTGKRLEKIYFGTNLVATRGETSSSTSTGFPYTFPFSF